MERYFLICALGFASVGALNDIRSGRIPNWLTYTSLAAALVVRGAIAGWPGLKSGLQGLALAGGLFLLLFLLGGDRASSSPPDCLRAGRRNSCVGVRSAGKANPSHGLEHTGTGTALPQFRGSASPGFEYSRFSFHANSVRAG